MTRRRKIAAGGAALAVAGLVAWWLLRPTALERALADLDATDPGWRFADVWAARAADPPPAPHAVAAALAALPMPAQFTAWQNAAEADPERSVWKRSAGEPWPPDPERRAAWRASAAAVAAGRLAADRPPGMTVAARPVDVFPTLLQHVQDARTVGDMLALDAVESAGRDVPGAVASIRATLSIGRGVAAEPFFPCALVRRWLARRAADATLRGLAAGEWPADALARVQAELAAEADPTLVTAALRDERAVLDQQLAAVAGWKAEVGSTLAVSGPTPRRLGLVGRTRYRLTVATDHLAALNEFNHLIAATRRPAHEWQAAVADVPPPPDDERHSVSHAAGTQARKMLVEQAVYHLAELRAAVLAVGCERFRLRDGRWPSSLAELPADLTPADTTDPFTGQPLVLRRLADGLAVYGLGRDVVDDGGRLGPALRTTEAKPGQDVGFRLWDVVARGRPAAQP